MRDERVAKVEAVIEASKSDEQALRVANAQLDSFERTRKALAERREADHLAVRKGAAALAQQEQLKNALALKLGQVRVPGAGFRHRFMFAGLGGAYPYNP